MKSVVDSASDLGEEMERKGAKRKPKWSPKWLPNRSKIASKFGVDFECDLGISVRGVGDMAWDHQGGFRRSGSRDLARHAPSSDRGRRI